MKVPKLSNREQLLTALVLCVIVIGAYVFLRVMPMQKDIARLKGSIESTMNKLIKTEVPSEPTENISALNRELNDQEQAMTLIRRSAENVEQRLASFDSQELKVRISQLASSSNVRIRVNEAFAGSPQSAPAQKNGKKSKAGVAMTELILPETSSWVARMSPGTLLQRPMQRLELEGDFDALQRFIYGLEDLPWQVTVLRLQIEKMPTLSPAGYAQLLKSELVLSL